MENIYILTYDGYLESCQVEYYAKDEEGIKLLVAKHQKEYFSQDVRNVVVDIIQKKVHFESRSNWSYDENDWEKETYHLLCLEKNQEE